MLDKVEESGNQPAYHLSKPGSLMISLLPCSKTRNNWNQLVSKNLLIVFALLVEPCVNIFVAGEAERTKNTRTERKNWKNCHGHNMWEHGNDQNNPAHKGKRKKEIKAMHFPQKTVRNCQIIAGSRENCKVKRGTKTKNQPQAIVLVQKEREVLLATQLLLSCCCCCSCCGSCCRRCCCCQLSTGCQNWCRLSQHCLLPEIPWDWLLLRRRRKY